VATKKVAPYVESEMEKEASQYSRACRHVKYIPRTTVRVRLVMAWEKFPLIKLWCVQVTVIPDDRRIIVFKRGTWMGLNTSMFIGGHSIPTSIFGDRLQWKNAQKNEKKNITSEVINRIIPHRSPLTTQVEWRP